MDKYLELIEKQEKLLTSIETRITSKEEELKRLSAMLDTEDERQKNNEVSQKEAKEKIDFLKKYQGKNLFWESIKYFFELKEEFKTEPLAIKIVLLGAIIYFFMPLVAVGYFFPSFLFPAIILELLLLFNYFFSSEKKKLKKLRKTTSIEIEEQKLESLEEELSLIKASIREIKTKQENTKNDLKLLYIKKNQLTIDMEKIKYIREKTIERLVDKDALNRTFEEAANVRDIVKRTRKEEK